MTGGIGPKNEAVRCQQSRRLGDNLLRADLSFLGLWWSQQPPIDMAGGSALRSFLQNPGSGDGPIRIFHMTSEIPQLTTIKTLKKSSDKDQLDPRRPGCPASFDQFLFGPMGQSDCCPDVLCRCGDATELGGFPDSHQSSRLFVCSLRRQSSIFYINSEHSRFNKQSLKMLEAASTFFNFDFWILLASKKLCAPG